MTSLADLVNDTKRHLSSYSREPMNKLGALVDASTETVSFVYDASAVQVGSYLQVGLELMYVWAVDPSSKTATVSRGELGSVAASHLAGARVTVNPRFPDFAIAKAINDDLLDLSTPINGLYALRTVELTSVSSSNGYDLPGAENVMEIVSITAKHPGRPREWSTVTNYDLGRNAHADFTSGYALTLLEGTSPGLPIRVTYKQSFAPLVNLTDDVETVAGLPASMHDLPPMGAAVRLVAPREIRRNFTDSQGDSRRSEEVPPGAIAASMRTVAQLRERRILAEAARLAQANPERSFMPMADTTYWR